jgi:hypothetical protein
MSSTLHTSRLLDLVGMHSMNMHAFLPCPGPPCSLLDELVEVHGVHKVETAGDCYIVSAGVLATGPDGFMRVLDSHDPADSAARVFAFAKGAWDCSPK